MIVFIKTCLKKCNSFIEKLILSPWLRITGYTLLGIAYAFCFFGFWLIMLGFWTVSLIGLVSGIKWFFATFSSVLWIVLGIVLSLLSVTLYLPFVIIVTIAVYAVSRYFFDPFELLLFGHTL